jgi:hypothetical protein
MGRPGSATNLKASDSTLPLCTAPDTKTRNWTEGSLGTTLGEDQFLVCRSTITDRTLLESIGGALKTQTLARSRRKEMTPVRSEPCGLGSACDEEKKKRRGRAVFIPPKNFLHT